MWVLSLSVKFWWIWEQTCWQYLEACRVSCITSWCKTYTQTNVYMLQWKNLTEVLLTEERFLYKQRSMANAYRKAEDTRVSQVFCYVFKKIIIKKARKLPRRVRPSDCYPLLLFHMGADEVAVSSPRVIKKEFKALGRAQVIFSSLLPVVGRDVEWHRQTQSITHGSVTGVTATTLGSLTMGWHT